MSWLTDLFNFKAQSASSESRPGYATTTPITSYRSWLWNQFKQTDTRIDYASEVGAMQLSSLFMAVANFIGLQMPKANPSLVTETDGEKEYDYEHEVVNLIRRPNPYHKWADYLQAVSVALLDDGNCYFKKVRTAGGKPVEFWYLPYGLVEPRFPGDRKSPDVPEDEVDDTNRFLSHFQYNQPQADPVLYKASDIIHLKRGVNDDFPQKGIGVFRPLVKEIYGDNAAALFTSTIMRNMGRVPWIISPKSKEDSLTVPAAQAFKEQFIKETTGDNAGTPLINTIPLEMIQPGFNPNELDLSGMRKMFEARVSAVTNIPAPVLQFLVGQENGTSYASYEQARKQAWESCIIPWLTSMQEDFTFQLLTEFIPTLNPNKQYIEFNTDEVPELMADENAVHKRAGDALRSGGITLDEYRSMIGQEPMEDEEAGKLHFVPSLVSPQTPEQMTEEPEPVGVAPPDPNALQGFADMEKMFERLESQMKDFIPK